MPRRQILSSHARAPRDVCSGAGFRRSARERRLRSSSAPRVKSLICHPFLLDRPPRTSQLLSCRRNRSVALGSTCPTSSSLLRCTHQYSILRCNTLPSGQPEVRRAVHSSALVDGVFCAARAQPLGSFGSVAAHTAIGFAGQLHRQSGVVRESGHRQDSVRPVVLGLHQSSSAEAELISSHGRHQHDARLQSSSPDGARACTPGSLRCLATARVRTSRASALGSPT